MKKYIVLGLTALAFTACDDFLDRKPLDFGDSDSYYKSETHLKIAANDFYENLPANGTGSQNTGLYADDKESDNLCAPSAQIRLYYGNHRVPDINASEWKFGNFRGINYFLQKIEENAGQITGSPEMINHYIGEAYFFRAFEHYRLLRYFGDAPIITKFLSDDQEELVQASRRYPRNEVARFILEDLDRATSLLKNDAPETGRVTKAAAYALKSRVALQEATWEKYHAGTCFVPGGPNWPGASMYPNYQFPAGSAQAEINYFLEQAIEASQKAVENHGLSSNYLALFNSVDLSSNEEVILARYYMSGIFSHNASYYLKAGGGLGVTRQAVSSYLMANGLPIYASNSGFYGDETSFAEFRDRDPRLAGNRLPDGNYPANPNSSTENDKYMGFGTARPAGNVNQGDLKFYYKPNIDKTGQDKAPTGYELNKWVSDDASQRVQNGGTTAVPIFRAAECMLNYIEAYYELYHNLGGNCDLYWTQIRNRAGVDPDYQKTINATDMNQEREFDLAVYSHGNMVDATLYNIRRERRCELMAEGRRFDDLKRWRSLDNMVNYQPEGFKLWDKMQDMYTDTELSSGLSSSSESVYLRPLQAYASSIAYAGYTFPLPHYLEPIPVSDFLLTVDPSTGASIIYQNPGWPTTNAGLCDQSYPNL